LYGTAGSTVGYIQLGFMVCRF